MLKKSLIIGILTAFSLLGLLGTALAENGDNSILGTDQFTFNTPETKADVAARNHIYDQEQLALVGTEAGGEITSSPRALEATRSHGYDQDHLAKVGTEGGNWEFSFDNQASRTNEAVAGKQEVNCSSC